MTRTRNPARLAGPLLLLALGVAMLACTVNPATGGRQLSLIGEAQEIQMGRDAHEQIQASMPIYEDAEAQAYVDRIGEELAAASERPDLPWEFTLLDDPAVNAFALPGGFIYITRGILTHMTSEAELASVLGHEIGHVTARHSVNQLSKQQLIGLGLGVGMVVSPELAQFGDLAQIGSGLLFLKFSRDDERQADELGLRYLVEADYDPRQMPRVFDMLGRVSAQQGAQRLPGWLATHPQPEDREETIGAQVARLEPLPGDLTVGRAELMAVVDGMVFGADPRQGYFREERFYHPELAFQMAFPPGWEHVNQVDRVVAVSGGQDAMVELRLASAASPRAAAEELAAQQGVTVLDSGSVEVHGLDGFAVAFRAGSEQQQLVGTGLFVAYGERVYQLLGLATEKAWPQRRRQIAPALDSFAPLTERRYLDVEPARVHVVGLERSITAGTFASQYPSSVPIETFFLINQLDGANSELVAGQRYKRIVGGELP